MYLKERWVYPQHVLLQRLLLPMDTNPPVRHVTPISFNLIDHHDFPEHDINPQAVKQTCLNQILLLSRHLYLSGMLFDVAPRTDMITILGSIVNVIGRGGTYMIVS